MKKLSEFLVSVLDTAEKMEILRDVRYVNVAMLSLF